MLNMSGLFNSLITISNNIFIGSVWDDVKEFFLKIALSIVTLILNFCKTILYLIFDLARIDIFTGEQIGELASRVYMILGVVMLFKITISCIQYLVNPSKSEDKEAGFGAIFKRVIITLGLLALVPSIFTFAKSAQLAIIDTLPKIILGVDSQNMRSAGSKYSAENIAENVVYYTELSFFSINSKCGGTGDDGIPALKNTYSSIGDIYDHMDDIFSATCKRKTNQYTFNWLVGIAVSGFLVFILVSMALDIAIRLLKFGFLELIAPVPIASYIDPKSSKKMFDSWVKTSVSVYLDLFIRLGVIYLIVFLFQSLIDSNFFAGIYHLNDGTPLTGGRTWILRIFVTIGMFMFAKDFPKFISEALGLKAAGDLGNMFKGKRLSGLAGAMVNPASNAIANWRKSRDMGRGRGESLRRALAGAARGTYDSARGIANGEGWSDMRRRHETSVARSASRAAASANRDRNREMGQTRLQRVKDRLNSLGGRVLGDESEAITNYNNRVAGINTRMTQLQSMMNSGTLTAAQMKNATTEYRNLQNELAGMKTEDGKKAWITNERVNIAARNEQRDELARNRNIITNGSGRLAEIQREIAGGVSNERRAELEVESADLRERVDKARQRNQTIISDREADVASRIQEVNKHNEEITYLENEKSRAETEINTRIHGSVYNTIDTYFGGPGSTGKAYINFSEMLGKNRSAIYTGEAMTKLRQNADILVDVDGNQLTFTTKFSSPGHEYTYEQMANLMKKVNSGQIDDAGIQNEGFASLAIFQSAFEDIEKKAAQEYINANIAAVDSKVASSVHVRLKRNEVNSTITEWWDRFAAELASVGIPKSELENYQKQFIANPGEFIKGASDLKERMATRGSRIIDAEKPKGDK